MVRAARVPPGEEPYSNEPRPLEVAPDDVALVLALQQGAGNAAVARALARRAALPGALRNGIAGLSGHDLDDVGVHYDSPAPAAVNALAFAGGDEIHLAPGRADLLPHEAWHVVQQRDGRVGETGRMGAAAFNDDPALEREAADQGRRAAASPGPGAAGERAGAPGSTVLQLAGLTVAALQQVLGGVPVPTGLGKQVTFPDTVLGGELSGLKFHVSATLAATGGGAVDRVHLSYYPAADAEHKSKVVHYDYSWRASDETFALYGQQLEKWQPFKTRIGAIKSHAGERIEELRGLLVTALHPPTAPIAIPTVDTPMADDDATPPNTPPNGWPDTPPQHTTPVFQFFKDPASNKDIDPAQLKPHEVYFYVQLLKVGTLKQIEPNEVELLKQRYVQSRFPTGQPVQFTPVPALAYVEIATKLGMMGAFSWLIHWTLSESMSLQGGFIVQTVTGLEVVVPQHGQAKNEVIQYQEAWPVAAGATHTQMYSEGVLEYVNDMTTVGEHTWEQDPHDDEFAHDEGFPGSASGFFILQSEATYYQGMKDLPNGFQKNHPDTWGGEELMSRPGIDKSDFTGQPGNAVKRTLRINWNRTIDGGKSQLAAKS